MKECSCVNLYSKKNFSLATCKMIFQFGHEKFRLGPAHLGGFSTGMDLKGWHHTVGLFGCSLDGNIMTS